MYILTYDEFRTPKNGIRAMKNKNKYGINRKIRKIKRKLDKLYPKYKELNITKNEELEEMVDIISKLEYKYIKYLKIR